MEKKHGFADAGLVENDYCDLDPKKICDNCCKCLNQDKKETDYKGIPAELDVDSMRVYYADEEEADTLEGLPPMDIDPALLAEWEEKLRLAQLAEIEAEKREEEKADGELFTRHDAAHMQGKRRRKRGEEK